MTKHEIRILSIAKLQLFPTARVYDLGAGSGSVAIECKRLLPAGQVLAIERNPRAIELIKRNCEKFGVDVTVIAGTLPEAMQNLPPADRIFLGGSGGKMPAILDACDERLNAGGWLVLNSVSMSSGADAYRILKAKGYHLEAAQVNIAVLSSKGNAQIWQARNPVTIIAAQKRG
ncbi:MAG: precorrin-6Y C5,15-methyltransferase (decarboxylating) subunit CbiT [Firmicutes bacterium]|nr:precorrin-6Y C5,15-methyltransferase (decarboxylating) subunit CbiT [Bacillota bacterium]